jgi:hypothetical protein
MADILLDNEAAPSTPASSKSIIWVDSTTKKQCHTDDSGVVHGLISSNYSASGVASVILGTSDAYITNSNLLLPAYGMQVGQLFRWYLNVSKTAAGTATPIIQVRIGTGLSTSDTSRLTMTGLAQTASTGGGGTLIIMVQVRTVSASGVIVGNFTVPHATFGSGQTTTVVSSTFDNTSTIGTQSVGISINAGASSAWTIDSVRAELIQ